MQRFIWFGIIVIAFGVGLAAGLVPRSGYVSDQPTAVDGQAHVTALQRQLAELQQQLAAKEAELSELRDAR